MKRTKGFTLIELMIVVAIIGILSAIAIPAYTDYVTRAKISEATSTLADLRVKMEQYYLDNRTYPTGGCVVVVPPAVAGATELAVPAAANFAFSCVVAVGPPPTYTLTAAGVPTRGMSGFTYTVDQLNVKATTAVPSGWTTNAACWVTKKGGEC